MKVIPETRRAY